MAEETMCFLFHEPLWETCHLYKSGIKLVQTLKDEHFCSSKMAESQVLEVGSLRIIPISENSSFVSLLTPYLECSLQTTLVQ